MGNNNVKKNTWLNIVKSICSIIFPLITFPYISRTLLVEGVGKINFGSSIVSYFSLIASLGITTYALKECSRNRAKREELSKVASEIFSINICSMTIAYVLLIVTLLLFKGLEKYRLLIIIQSSAILFLTLGADWINMAMEDYTYITVRTIIFQVLSIALMFIFVRKPEDYLKYALITVVASSGSNIMNIIYRKKYCDVRFLLDMNLKKHLSPILLFFSMIIAQQIYVNSDITILGLVKGDYEVGLYTTSVKIYTVVNTIVASVSVVVWPQIAEAYKNGKQEVVNEMAKYSLGFILTFGLPSIVGLNIIAKELIILIAGSEYVGAEMSLHILTIALLFSFVGGWIGNTNYLPNGKEKICLFATCASATINIVLNIILIPRWGLNAAALTTVVSEFVAMLILIMKFDSNEKIANLFEMIWKPVAGCVIIIFISMFVRATVRDTNLIILFSVLIGGTSYFAVLLALKDDFLLGYVKPIVIKIKGFKKI